MIRTFTFAFLLISSQLSAETTTCICQTIKQGTPPTNKCCVGSPSGAFGGSLQGTVCSDKPCDADGDPQLACKVVMDAHNSLFFKSVEDPLRGQCLGFQYLGGSTPDGGMVGKDFSCTKPTVLVINMVPDFQRTKITAEHLGGAYNVVEFEARSCDPKVLESTLSFYIKEMRRRCGKEYCPTDLNLNSHGINPKTEPFLTCPDLLKPQPPFIPTPPPLGDHYTMCEDLGSGLLSPNAGPRKFLRSDLIIDTIDKVLKSSGCALKGNVAVDTCFAGSCKNCCNANTITHGDPDCITVAYSGSNYHYAPQICRYCDGDSNGAVTFEEYKSCYDEHLKCLVSTWNEEVPKRKECIKKSRFGPPLPAGCVDPKLTLLNCSGFDSEELKKKYIADSPCNIAPFPREVAPIEMAPPPSEVAPIEVAPPPRALTPDMTLPGARVPPAGAAELMPPPRSTSTGDGSLLFSN